MIRIILAVIVYITVTLIVLFGCNTRRNNRDVKFWSPVITTAAELYNEESTTEYIIPDAHTIDVDIIFQNPELPTGCEITSLAMLLNYLGFRVSKTELASGYLNKNYNGDVGFDQAFIGTPESDGGYGCFAPVIRDSANKYLAAEAEGYLASDITGTDFEELYEYIGRGMPVVAWCSMGLINVYRRFAFYDRNKNEVYWYDNEHCVLLVGYDREAGTVTAADPLAGRVVYSAARFEQIYNELGKQAVIVEKLK